MKKTGRWIDAFKKWFDPRSRNRTYYKVVAAGIANSGKSEVLSALAGCRGIFPSGDVPRITRNIKRKIVDRLILVDTPGLDAHRIDTNKATKQILSADIVLWCHSLRSGGLNSIEIDALNLYSKHNYVIRRTCFILTHADDVANDKVIQDVSQNIVEQLRDKFHLEFKGVDEMSKTTSDKKSRLFYVVGIETYWRGIEGKTQRPDQLLLRSELPQLEYFLSGLAKRKK